MAIHQIFLGLGAVIKKLYQEDLFSTYLWKGDSSTNRTITNGLDLSTEGGMVWFKQMSGGEKHQIYDTARGVTKALQSSASEAEITLANGLKSFTTTGFTMGSDNTNNDNGAEYVAWSLRKAKGFFDIVEWTQSGSNGSARTLNHNLECIPGFIMLKQTTGTENWICYHRDFSDNQFIKLNSTHAINTDANASVNSVSSTQFVVGADNNRVGSYVAYLFGGGQSTATNAASCSFNGTSGLDVAASSNVNIGTGTFCVEAWVYVDNLPGTGSPSYGRVFQLDGPTGNSAFSNFQITINPSDNTLHAWAYGGGNPVAIVGSKSLKQGYWNHIAVTRDSNNLITQYVNGTPDGTVTASTNFNPNSGSPRIRIGYYDTSGNGKFDGKISNLRVTVGEPVYTSAFRPSTEPLTTSSQVTSSSNVKLLCCNSSSSATASTVTPGTISNNGTNPTAYGNNPFDDPAGFAFGDSGDQNLIKCGSYVGNGNNNGPEVYLGWEPSLLMIRTMGASATGNWVMIDNMRGADDEKQELMSANTDNGDFYYDVAKFTSTGFKLIRDDFSGTNGDGKTILYIAIRRPDGYVSKPPELGTSVFGLTTGAGSTANPAFIPNFVVDFNTLRKPGESGQDWQTSARLIGPKVLDINNTDAESGHGDYVWNSSVGVFKDANSDYQAWSWKRGQSFDVVTYTGDGVSGRQIPHSLNKVPEMMWVKRRTSGSGGMSWLVYHKGLDGGTNPQTHYLLLNSTAAEGDEDTIWNDTAPTSTHFTLGGSTNVNRNDSTHIAMLFASVDGISKVGSYTGTGNALSVTTGFQPRFLIIKNASSGTGDSHWWVVDTTRGWGSGDDNCLRLDVNNAAVTGMNLGAPTSTGFDMPANSGNSTAYNKSGDVYIYYAHA